MKNKLTLLIIIIITNFHSNSFSQVNVTWKDLVGVSLSGGVLTKTESNNLNAGAASNETIPTNYNGYVEWTIVNTVNSLMLGLSSVNASSSFNTINYGVTLQALQTLHTLILLDYKRGKTELSNGNIS
ncbi:MAG: hypothetical protein IPN72_05570 [Saprospiraceae bacterium]|nr:hypothetical protein [Saprospiraceae bacterium]